MEVAPETVLEMARQIDPAAHQELAELFSTMRQDEHSARHKTRHGLVSKFTNMIDDERSGT